MSTHKGPAGDEHEHVDIDPYIPTGQCTICTGLAIDDRLPEERGPDNPYDPGSPIDVDEPAALEPETNEGGTP